MAGYISNGIAIDYHDGEGSCKIGQRIYRWTFHEYGGPFFLRKDGECLKNQPGESHPVWGYFDKWLEKYRLKRNATRNSNIVKLDL